VLVGCGGPGATGSPTPSATGLTADASPSLQPTASPLPSIDASPSAPPLAEETPTPGPACRPDVPYTGPWTVDPLLPGSAVKVTVTELNLRDGPCAAAKKVGTLKKGTILIVAEDAYGPVRNNGLPWYFVFVAPNVGPAAELPVLPAGIFPDGVDAEVGWIAANDGSRPYVTPLPPRCPTTVDFENVQAMLPAERLACLETSIVLQGTFGCGGCGGASPMEAKPEWLAGPFEFDRLAATWPGPSLALHLKPAGPARPPDGSIIRVTVHVDDPAALKCTREFIDTDPPYVVPAKSTVAYCRERLVVESYEILGTDPNYQGG
jgi:hypothetical protein